MPSVTYQPAGDRDVYNVLVDGIPLPVRLAPCPHKRYWLFGEKVCGYYDPARLHSLMTGVATGIQNGNIETN